MSVTNLQFKNPSRTGLDSIEVLRVPTSSLTHEFTPSPVIDRQVVPLLRQVLADSKVWFKQEREVEFDNYNVEHGSIMKPHMWSDSRLLQVLGMLNLPLGHVQKIYLPWWNESAGSEIKSQLTDSGLHVVLGACHSYQKQMMRKGLDIPGVCSVSVAGFVHTSDDRMVISLRNGINFPNTYYFSAGTLGMTPAVQSGQTSIYQFYLKEELRKEYGMRADDVGEAELFCKTVLHGGDHDIAYVFAIQTHLTFDQVCMRYNSNCDPDKKEHQGQIPLRTDEVVPFVREFYKGEARNDPKRQYSERVLLAQGAAPLLAYVGEDPSLLDELAAKYAQPV